jgi:predicted transcriptional regulator YheO
MHKEEKLSVVRKLHNSGIFILKGAVSETADRLMISEATVYRYLNQIKKEERQQ